MSELTDLHKLYLPSQWSKRFTPETICEEHVEISKKLCNEIKKEVPCELDIPYGDKENEKMDVFGIDLPTDAPIFVFIHGGYWQEEVIQRSTSCLMSRSLYKNGCKTIIIGYTLCPKVSVEEIIKEIENAVIECMKYALQHKTRSISIGGHSAGAHLAMSLFPTFCNNLKETEQNLIKSVFLIGGIYNLLPLIHTPINEPLKLTEETAKVLSPMFKDFKSIATKSTTFYVITSENDTPAFIEQSRLFYDHLNQQSVKCQYFCLKELDHFDIMEKIDEENCEIIKLILESL